MVSDGEMRPRELLVLDVWLVEQFLKFWTHI